MNKIQGNFLDFHSMGVTHEKSLEAIKSSFYEICLTTALIGGAVGFSATASIASSLVVFNISLLAINLFARFGKILFETTFPKQKKGDSSACWIKTCEIIPAFTFALLWGTTGGILVHELGHVLAVSLIHRNPNLRVSIDGLFSGSTSWKGSRVTPLGKFLGPSRSLLLISAAGPLFGIVFATIGLVLSYKFRENHRKISEYLFFSSIFSVINHLSYAHGALSANKKNLVHDFIALWRVGIHPIVSMIVMASLPIFASLIYFNNKIFCYHK